MKWVLGVLTFQLTNLCLVQVSRVSMSFLSQTAKLLNGMPADKSTFSQQIAFNCIPQIDEFTENGYTREEMKMVWETQKIFADSSITVNPTCVRVPVFYGHAESLR